MKWPTRVHAQTTCMNGRTKKINKIIDGLGITGREAIRKVFEERKNRGGKNWEFYGCSIFVETPATVNEYWICADCRSICGNDMECRCRDGRVLDDQYRLEDL